MGELIVFVLALFFIWMQYGFVAMLILIGGWLFFAWVGKPKYRWNNNWASGISKFMIIIIGIIAIQQHWEDPAVTAIAFATALIMIFKVD